MGSLILLTKTSLYRIAYHACFVFLHRLFTCVSSLQPFRTHILRLLSNGLALSLNHWIDNIKGYDWASTHWSAVHWSEDSCQTSSDSRIEGGITAATCDSSDVQSAISAPPLEILQHTPVATLLNHILMIFNEVLLPSWHSTLTLALQASMFAGVL